MKIRSMLPSLATITTLGMLGISSLILQDALNPTGKFEPAAPLSASLTSASGPQVEPQNQNMPTDLDSLMNRPLFSPSRRIPEVEELPKTVEAAPPPQIVERATPPAPEITMIGILEDGGRLMALIRGSKGSEQWVGNGANIEGWRVVQITAQSITLQLNGESVDIYTVD